MNLAIVIKKGQHYNNTLASIKFNKYGQNLPFNIITCDSWVNGFNTVKNKFTHALFVNSGTVFFDIETFVAELKVYPNSGLVGHLTDPLNTNNYYYLDDQCFFLNMACFNSDDFHPKENAEYVVPERSSRNIHHTYTPLWIKGTSKTKSYTNNKFGEGLIARALTNNDIPVNWHQKIREHKMYLYSDVEIQKWNTHNLKYITIAEEQLWIFNNEPVKVADYERLICPASGLFWLFNIIHNTTNIALVDISNIQMKFARELWNKWDGNNYGEFVYYFYERNNLTHINLDKRKMDKLERIKLMSKTYFINEINKIFNKHLIEHAIDDFDIKWNNSKNKHIEFIVSDIVTWMPKQNIYKKTGVWVSNILEYKYTLLKNTDVDIDTFQNLFKTGGKLCLV